MTFKERYLMEANGVNSIAELKELADYHSGNKNLFKDTAPFMKQEERQTVSDNQHDFGQTVDQKWSDRFTGQGREPVAAPAPVAAPDQSNDLTKDMPDIDSVTGPVSGLESMFG